MDCYVFKNNALKALENRHKNAKFDHPTLLKMSIKTKLFFCKALKIIDFEEIITMYNEKDSNKYIEPLLNRSENFYREFLEKKLESKKEDTVFWTVRSRSTEELIGTINLNTFGDTDLVQVGCHLKRNYWAQNYATELLGALLDYAQNERKLKAVHGVFNKDNVASKRLMENLGFRPYESRFHLGVDLFVYRRDFKS